MRKVKFVAGSWKLHLLLRNAVWINKNILINVKMEQARNSNPPLHTEEDSTFFHTAMKL